MAAPLKKTNQQPSYGVPCRRRSHSCRKSPASRSLATALSKARSLAAYCASARRMVGDVDHSATECHKLSASEASDPGRHHVGIPGDFIAECPGDFIGIRRLPPNKEAASSTHKSGWDGLIALGQIGPPSPVPAMPPARAFDSGDRPVEHEREIEQLPVAGAYSPWPSFADIAAEGQNDRLPVLARHPITFLIAARSATSRR
jgi:hypothetical protein